MLNQNLVKNALESSKTLTKKDIDKVIKESQEKNKTLENYILEKNLIPEATFYQNLASEYKIPFVDLKNQTIRKDILTILPEPIVQAHQVTIFEKDEKEKKVKIATVDPEDLQTFEFIRKKTGFEPIIYLTTPAGITTVLKQYHKGLKAEFKEITTEIEDEKETGKDLKKLAQDLPIIRIIDTLLEYAIFENASDIHIEPTEKEVIVRYRIDGILRDVMTLPKKVQSGVAARIKILSNLKIDEHRLPQDGRFKVETDEYKVSFRVSILPVYDGEKIVMRLLSESSRILTLEQLGLLKSPLDTLRKSIKEPNGIIFVTGPTGSGKTTTLYTIMNILNNPGINISTIEDPIEYRMPRINQSQVSPKIGFSFANGLRALLRQDPDIIMVGEIRDKETAEIATHSALTGHLVLTTLHTNSAAGTLPRMGEMGIPSFLLASTANVVVAQRLVRKICQECITSFNLTSQIVKEIEKQVDFTNILEVMEREKIIQDAKTPFENLLFYKGKGCKKCDQTGYKGRIGIYEVLDITPKISELILNRATQNDLAKEAANTKMIFMVQDGFLKAKNGITTIEEILRVTKD